MLAIRIDLDHGVVIMVQCELEAGAHGATNTEIEREDEHFRAGRTCPIHRTVSRSVVNDQDVGMRHDRLDLSDRACDALFLVPRWRHDQEAQRGRLRHGR